MNYITFNLNVPYLTIMRLQNTAKHREKQGKNKIPLNSGMGHK